MDENQDILRPADPEIEPEIVPEAMTEADPEIEPEIVPEAMTEAEPLPEAATEAEIFPEAVTEIKAEPPKKRRGLWIGLGCLALALLAAGTWWLLNNTRRDPLKKLKQAAEKTLDSYLDYVQELPNLRQCLENGLALLDSDTARFALSCLADGVGSQDAQERTSFALSLDLERDEKTQRSRLGGSVTYDGITFPLELYLDPDQLQLTSSLLLNEGEAIALPIRDLTAQWNASALSELLQAKLPEDFSLDFLTEPFSDRSLEEAFGKDWTKFADSVSFRKAKAEDGTDPFTGSGESYLLTWDQALLDQLNERAARMTESMDTVYGVAIVQLLKTLSDDVLEPRFRLDDGMVTGFAFQGRTEDGTPTGFRMELLGQTSPWEESVCVFYTWDQATQRLEPTETLKSAAAIADGQLRQRMTFVGETTETYEVVYNDADGSYSLAAAKPETLFLDLELENRFATALEHFSMRMVPVEGGLQITYGMDMDGLAADSGLSVQGSLQFDLTLSSRISAIDDDAADSSLQSFVSGAAALDGLTGSGNRKQN